MNTIATKLLLAGVSAPIVDSSPDGGQSFIVAGTYAYKVPDNVTYISAVVIGAGGKGGNTNGASSYVSGGGGGGGALAYSNKIPVTPGEILYVTVGISRIDGGSRYSGIKRGNIFGSDYLIYAAPGNPGADNTQTGGTYGLGGSANDCIGQVKYSGGNGGAPGAATISPAQSPYRRGGGGGGAAGYAGNGGNGAQYYSGIAGIGGAGGGGAAGGYELSGTPQDTVSVGGLGGGTGIYGLGSSGAGGNLTSTSLSVLAGDTGSSLDGDSYNSLSTKILSGFGAGGGGAHFTTGASQNGSNGIDGAVRIIHGTNKTYPIDSTENEISMVASTTSSTSSISLPADIQQGDCLVLLDLTDYSSSASQTAGGSQPTGWTLLDSSTNLTTYTKFVCSCLNVTEDNISGLANSIVNGMGTGTSYTYSSKILLQFRGLSGYTVYDTSNYGSSNFVIESSTAPANFVTNTSLFQYSRGISVVISFFKGTLALTPGTDITHSGATFVPGPSNLSYAAYRIYPRSATTTANSVTMLDKGVNNRAVCMITGY